jgi:hypothetical protein
MNSELLALKQDKANIATSPTRTFARESLVGDRPENGNLNLTMDK